MLALRRASNSAPAGSLASTAISAGQQRVQPPRVERLVAVADNLTPRVHAAVGAPGDAHAERLAEDPLDRVLELLLDAALPGLARPAREGAAVVGQRQLRDEGVVRPARASRAAGGWAQLQSVLAVA